LGGEARECLQNLGGQSLGKKIIWKKDDNNKIDLREVDCEDVGGWM
jgi:hypothetical protein